MAAAQKGVSTEGKEDSNSCQRQQHQKMNKKPGTGQKETGALTLHHHCYWQEKGQVGKQVSGIDVDKCREQQ